MKNSPKSSNTKFKRSRHYQPTESDSGSDSYSNEKHHNTKTFYYSILELSLRSIMIKIDTNKYTTLNDLKSEIASTLFISNDQLQFIYPPKANLKNIRDKYEFTLKVCCSHIDIDFLIPNGEKITIQDINTKKYYQIITILEKEGYYFSQQCIIKNFHLFFSGEEIQFKEYPFLSIEKSGPLELKLFGNTITINYDKKKFFFSENEYSYDAISLFKKVFPNSKISIQELNGKAAFKLEPTKQYRAIIEISSLFIDLKKGYSYFIHFDLVSTVFDVQKKLIEKINFKYKNFDPKNLILYDNSKQKITDLNTPIKNIQNLNIKFYFQYICKDEDEIKGTKYSFSNSYSHITNKYFSYSITNLSKYHYIYKHITIDINECHTYDDLLQKIASDIHVSKNQLKILNKPEKELKELVDYYKFVLSFNSLSPNIDLLLPNKKKNSY